MSEWYRYAKKFFQGGLNVTSPANNSILQFNSSAQEWGDVTAPTFTSLAVDDSAYGAGWNGSLLVPTRNAVYDKIETIVSDTAYAASWNGVTTISPSKNAVYDEIESIYSAWTTTSSLTFSANGTTWTPGTPPFARYKIIGKTVFLQVETGSGNIGADTGYLIIGGLPAAPNANYSDRVIIGHAYVFGSGATTVRESGHVLIDNSPAELNIFRPDLSSFLNVDEPWVVHFSIVYESA